MERKGHYVTYLEQRPVPKNSSMIRGEYLRKQAEILIAMSRATFDLGMAGRLREMASELQARAAEQEDEHGRGR